MLYLAIDRLIVLIAPGSSCVRAAIRIALTHPSGSSGKRAASLRRGGLATPEKRWYRAASDSTSSELWLAPGTRRQCPGGSRRGRCGIDEIGGEATLSIQRVRLGSSVLAGSTRFALKTRLCETALYIEGLGLLKHVVAGAREFVGERLGGHDIVGARALALIEALGLGAVAAGKVSRLDERPGKIAIAIFDVTLALLLAVGKPLTVYTARIRSEIAHCGKALDRARLEHDDGGEHLADARGAGEQLEFRARLHPFTQASLNLVDLGAQRVDDRHVGAHGETHILGLVPFLKRLLRERFHLTACNPRPGLPCHDVLHRQDMAGSAPAQLQALSRQVAQRTLLRRADITRGQDVKPQKLRQMRRIRFIPTMLKPLVLLDRRRIGQPHPIARRLQPIDQPIPVIGRFHDHPRNLFTVRRKRGQYRAELVWHTALARDTVRFVTHHNHTVCRMQIDSAIFHLRPPFGLTQVRKLNLTPSLRSDGRPAI